MELQHQGAGDVGRCLGPESLPLISLWTDHSAVQAVLESQIHLRSMAGGGRKSTVVEYEICRPGRTNVNADVLSHSPQSPAPEMGI